MSELTDHLGLPATAPAEALRTAASAFLAAPPVGLVGPKRARLILAARRALGEVIERKQRPSLGEKARDSGESRPRVATESEEGHHPQNAGEYDRLREANEKLRRASIGSGLPCRLPCKGIGRLHDVAPEGWAVTCRKCSRVVPGRTAGEAIRAWESER